MGFRWRADTVSRVDSLQSSLDALVTPPFVAITPGMTVPSGEASLSAATGHPVIRYGSSGVGTTTVDFILPDSYYGIDLEIAILVAREGFSSDTFSIESQMVDLGGAVAFVDSGTIVVATDAPQEYTLPNTFQVDGSGAQGLISLAVRRDAPDASGTIMDLYQIIVRPK